MFSHDLRLQLKLLIDETPFEAPPANIKGFSFEMSNYGFDANVDFWIETGEDLLYSYFTTSSLMEVVFTVESYYNPPDVLPEPIVLIGIAYCKKMQEMQLKDVEDTPVWFRHYFIQFADVASVLWKQHFPTELHVDKTMKDVITLHTTSKITAEYSWPVLETQHPILFLGLGTPENYANIPEKQASFYDFIGWYLQKNNGIFSYYSTLHKYTFSEEKQDYGVEQPLDRNEVESWEFLFPEVPRYKVVVQNSYTESAEKQEIANEKEVTGIRKDVLTRTAISDTFTAFKTLEESKFKIRGHEINLVFKDYPTVTVKPGYLLILSEGDWGTINFCTANIYRIFRLKMKGVCHQPDPQINFEKELEGYDIEMTANLELQDESYPRYWPFNPPKYPVYVEGKILSETGSDTEETYQFYQDTSSQDIYKVQVPLWENQNVIVPYLPHFFSGHFYFPAFKKARVLLAFNFQDAWIAEFLDWRVGAKLPLDTQGNHILLGLEAENQTSINHIYQDNKPIFNIHRKLKKDTEMIQLKEGCMILETKEET